MLILGILSDNILVSCLRIALAVTTALLLKHFGIQRITNNLYDRQSAVLQLTIRSLLPHTPLDPLPGANSTNDPYAIQLARLRRFVYICYQSVFMFFASMNPTVYRIWLTEEMRRRAILAEQAERTEQDSNENNNEDNNPRNDEDQDDVNENNDTYYSDNSSSDSDESFDSDEQFYFADATGIDNGEARHRNLACRVLAGDTLVAAEED
ncbi:hypothetical protein NADFUDRAFT_84473 [Nadsonia fulvescens var. elongata DSM 6958]|uniref:Uncharacterized protein n=1 Tax=Nadsonia fulvescens var. elongata DSM 6958 TaxID=857566 RepID=A0A1E3PD40_9ASCO|nr:hypothetical protein NADFUDRAFT_84473 [Nadsonia fulvescens var. elongata DSM 6958]